MADKNNALVLSDNDNGTQSAEWTPIEEITPDQKVLIGNVDPRSGTIQATWNPSSEAAVFKDGTFTVNGVYDAQEDDCDGYKTVTVDVPGVTYATSPSAFTLLTNIRNLNVEIPSGVTSIGNAAFSGCTGLTSIEIPSSVTSISTSAFNGCTGLTSIEIPSSVTLIDTGAFRGCTGLTSIEIPNGVTSICEDAFYNCTGLTSIEIPNGVTSIGAGAFTGCTGLTSIEIPSSVTSIEVYAFNDCTNLASIVVHKAEDSISGAPWGAPNATVTWDG